MRYTLLHSIKRSKENWCHHGKKKQLIISTLITLSIRKSSYSSICPTSRGRVYEIPIEKALLQSEVSRVFPSQNPETRLHMKKDNMRPKIVHRGDNHC